MEANDIYFGLICFLAVCVLALGLGYYIDFIQKDGRDE